MAQAERPAMRYRIVRSDRSTVNGRPTYPSGTCYVTGPHFGRGIFSSTADPAKASTYTLEEAEELVRTKWQGLAPALEAVDAR